MRREASVKYIDFNGGEHDTKEKAELAEADFLRETGIAQFVEEYGAANKYKDRTSVMITNALVAWLLYREV
jgi:hypothetical protein